MPRLQSAHSTCRFTAAFADAYSDREPSGRYRTNLGVVNPTENPFDVTVRVFDNNPLADVEAVLTIVGGGITYRAE